MRYWVNVRSEIRESRRKRLAHGDRVAFYTPRPEQCFNAIGEVGADGEIARRPCTTQVQPLIDALDFIRDKAQWGWTFRRGFFEISESDFRKIEESSLPGAAPSR